MAIYIQPQPFVKNFEGLQSVISLSKNSLILAITSCIWADMVLATNELSMTFFMLPDMLHKDEGEKVNNKSKSL